MFIPKHSLDAYLFGTTASPDDAYKYAKGGPIEHPLGFEMQLREPLDFYAVTDHGFPYGKSRMVGRPNNPHQGLSLSKILMLQKIERLKLWLQGELYLLLFSAHQTIFISWES
ncbi:MAG: hypothetical protein Ct9H300mP20_07490 [Gammaproteobacteria bacterium]|nr:MAG: hypothetical protein Ct9H300mP20_07490 [Gammaproteobacteria bacterium]